MARETFGFLSFPFGACLLLAVVVLVIPAVLVSRARRSRSSGWRLAAAIYVPLAAVGYIAYASYVPRPNHFDGIPVGFHALVGFPSAVFFAVLIGRISARRWKAVGALLIVWTIAALVIAGAVLMPRTYDGISLGDYSLRGWYWIWFCGASPVGLLVIAWLAARTAFRLLKKMAGPPPHGGRGGVKG